MDAGIDSLKIEGRMKNAYYVASTVHAYRTIVDDCLHGKFDPKKAEALTFELANIYNRGGFSDGYFFHHNGAEMISKDRPNNQGVAIGSLERVEKGTITLRLSEAVYRQDVLELTTKKRRSGGDYILKGRNSRTASDFELSEDQASAERADRLPYQMPEDLTTCAG